MRMTGARILIECLLEQGVDTIFGYPGGTILNVYDELYRYSDRIRHILTAHEQGASHAADGYARVTGKVGVCFATSGPGCTNLTTGIATAYMDSSPLVFITCNVAEGLLGRDAFQEVDITGISMPITKCSYLVKDADQLADVVREAFYLASSGRPGPILIDIPKNVTAELGEYEFLPKDEHISHGHLAQIHSRSSHGFKSTSPREEDIDEITRLISKSERPVILCGGGVIRSCASGELTRLAETIDAPVACTMMGLGGISGEHELFTGLIGMHGTKASNLACVRSDLVIAVGCRFSDRVIGDAEVFAESAKIIHIDIDRAEINKNIQCDLHLVADAKEALGLLNQRLSPQERRRWLEDISSLKERPKCAGCDNFQLLPSEIMESIEELTEGEALIVTDVGQHQLWSTQHFKFKAPCQLVTSGGFGTMGFGYGAAMGAKLGSPDSIVVHTTGDGCFRMNCNEMATAAYYDIPVITVLFNNGTLGMVRQWQTLLYDKRYSQTTLDRGPDFMKLADAYSIPGYRVQSIGEFRAAFAKAVEEGRGALIECVLEMDEKVRPMVASGMPLDQFILE